MDLMVLLILATLWLGDFGTSTKREQEEQTDLLRQILQELKKKK